MTRTRSIPSYEDVVLYCADFDVDTLTVSNPVAITDYDIDSVYEYPRWNADESLIIYDSNRSGVYQMYAYRLADGVTGRISEESRIPSQFGNFEACPK